MTDRVIVAIDSERAYQEQKWPDHVRTVGECILIMEKCLADAKTAWVTQRGDAAALHEIRQVTAVGVFAMELHGAPLRSPRPHMDAFGTEGQSEPRGDHRDGTW